MMLPKKSWVLAVTLAPAIAPAQEPASRPPVGETAEQELVARVRSGLIEYAAATDGVSYHVIATKYQFNSHTKERTCNSQDGVISVLGDLTQWKGQTFICTDNPPSRLYGGKVTAVLSPGYIAWRLPKSPAISRMVLTGDPATEDDMRSHWTAFGAEIHSQAYDSLTSPEHGMDSTGLPTLVSRFLDDAPRHGVQLKATSPPDHPDVIVITAEQPGRGKTVAEFQVQGTLAFKTSFHAYDGKGRLRSRSTVTYLPHTFLQKGDIPLPESAQVTYWNPLDDSAMELDRTLEISMTADSWSFGEISTDPGQWLETSIAQASTPVEDYHITENGLMVLRDSPRSADSAPATATLESANCTGRQEAPP